MLKKRLIVLLGVATLTLGIGQVIAACGDSVCGVQDGDWKCVAEFPGGDLRDCTEASRCNINCP